MNYGAAKFSDLGGRTNPGNVWSPAFLFFKQAVDRRDSSEVVLKALMRWLRQYRDITDGQLESLIRQGPGAAVSSIIKLIGAGYSEERLPPDALHTITKAVKLLATQKISARQNELEQEKSALDKLRGEFSEGAKRVVNFMLEDDPAKMQKPTRRELFNGALASIDELIAAETKKLELLKTHRQGLIQKFSAEMKTAPPQQNESASKIVNFMLEDGPTKEEIYDPAAQAEDPNIRFAHLKKLKPQLPIRVQTPDGKILDTTFNGYYDLTPLGQGIVPSVGYRVNGHLTHSALKSGHKILTPIPSPEEWKTYEL